MKTSINLSIFFIFFCSLMSSATSKPTYDSLSCLEIEGKILNAFDGANACKIQLWTGMGVIDSVVLKRGNVKFKFVLQSNTHYTIRITKKGFIDKLVCVNTNMKGESDVISRFSFDTELLEEYKAEGLNKDALDFPVAIIHYDETEECFNYNKEYTARLKREVYGDQPEEQLAHKGR